MICTCLQILPELHATKNRVKTHPKPRTRSQENITLAQHSAPLFEFGLPHDCLNINRQVHFLRWEQGANARSSNVRRLRLMDPKEMSAKWRMLLLNSTHRIHLWDIYPHLVDVHIKCIGKYTIHASYGQRDVDDVAHLKLQPRSAFFSPLLSINIQNIVHDATILTFITIPCIRLLQLSKAFKHYVASPEMSFRLPSNHLMLNCGDAANKIQMRAAKPTRSSCARRKHWMKWGTPKQAKGSIVHYLYHFLSMFQLLPLSLEVEHTAQQWPREIHDMHVAIQILLMLQNSQKNHLKFVWKLFAQNACDFQPYLI